MNSRMYNGVVLGAKIVIVCACLKCLCVCMKLAVFKRNEAWLGVEEEDTKTFDWCFPSF